MPKDEALQSYLASKYMTGPKADAILLRAGKKKRKTGHSSGSPLTSTGSGIASGSRGGGSGSGFLVDDDDDSWKAQGEEEVRDGPVVERIHNIKTMGKAWKSLSGKREPTPEAEDEKPQIVPTEPTPPVGGLMAPGQTLPGRKKKRRTPSPDPADDAHNETIYRDSSGRKIDTKREKAELARKKAGELEKEMKRMEWGKGLVQREEREKRRREEEEMKSKPLARFADDEELNAELKERERWNDPAAAFLTKKTTTASSSSKPKTPKYTGPPPPPNRFGIPPGFRWDGVDRSNGFERNLMQARNAREVGRLAAHQWSTEDM
ncbi:hypothetical protein BT69DRAFT_1275942 [Atractiella rhizophila]|nr:hypothetical protein BT69DRAFT_1275942 [Atractiella rhizophila]